MIVAARARLRISNRLRRSIDNVGAVPREVADAGYYSAKSRRALCPWTRSSRRSRPATAGLCHPRPEVAYPAICLPGTGCDGSYRPGGVGSATLCGCKLWSRYSARSSRAGDSGSSCLEKVNYMHRPQPAQMPLWGQSAGKHGSMGQHQERRGSHGAIPKLSGGRPGQPAKLVVATTLTRKHR